VEPSYGGQGLGSALVQGILDNSRERGRPVLPYCPFIRSWIQKHPDYLGLVPPDRRPEFGLPAGP
jgi:predicted GNAT family acetyltransferase